MTEPRPTYSTEGEQLTPAIIIELRVQLANIKRDALGLVRTVELVQGIPPEKSAIRNRAERRAVDNKPQND